MSVNSIASPRKVRQPMSEPMQEVIERLNRIEMALESLLKERIPKDWYSTAEVAQLLGKAEYTVREWCRQGRIRATKKAYARGAHSEWLISHAELIRVQNEGLLPFPLVANRVDSQ
jgi:excisionase family DNA binding protein